MTKKSNKNTNSFTRLLGGNWFTLDNVVRHLGFVMFLFGLTIIYINSTHSSEGTIRQIDRAKAEVKELRWEYMSAKSDLMYKSKQTEVAAAVQPLGLEEITAPPKKIVIPKGEY